MVDHPDNSPTLVPTESEESEESRLSNVPSALDPKASQGSDHWMATGNEDITVVRAGLGAPLTVRKYTDSHCRTTMMLVEMLMRTLSSETPRTGSALRSLFQVRKLMTKQRNVPRLVYQSLPYREQSKVSYISWVFLDETNRVLKKCLRAIKAYNTR